MKRFFLRMYLLNKRLFKNPAFLIILFTIPLMILALNILSPKDDGIIRVAVAAEDPADPVASNVISRLADGEGGIVSIKICDTAKEAEELVRYGEANAAWIFRADMEHAVIRFLNEQTDPVCVTVIERGESITLRLSHEKLGAAVSEDLCRAFMQKEYSEKVSTDYDEADLREFFDKAIKTDELFEFRYVSGDPIERTETSFLMLPVRGMLASAILLCGFAMTLIWQRDEEKGVFCRISQMSKPFFEFGYHLIGITDVGVIALISIFISGLTVSFFLETAAMLVYCLNCTAFVMLVRRLLRRPGFISAAAPIIIVAFIIVNPVFFDLPYSYPIRILTPVYYYIQSAYDPAYLLYGTAYFAACSAAVLILSAVSSCLGIKRQKI